ncbi:hypothetical protein DIPPA_04505 [Diplonema papillatum]|nr:hypothetical protein DIPPA_04505 [Diplonema papillatum]|eukprot:gene2261-3492_t
MDELSGDSLIHRLFVETTKKANNVLFLHPQLALCGLVHSVDEREQMFGYSHVPSMRNLILLAVHAFDRTRRPQSVVMMGEWTPTLIQAIVASIHDALHEGASLKWGGGGGEVKRLQSALHLLLLFSTLSGRYNMMALSISLGAGRTRAAAEATLSTLWLYPRVLGTLRDHGHLRFVAKLPVFQHVLAAPKELLRAFLPSPFLDEHAHPEDSGKWVEFVDMFTALGFRDLRVALEPVLHALAVVLLMLDTVFESANPRMLANIDALNQLLGCTIDALIEGVKPYVDDDGRISSGFPDALYLHLVDWIRSSCSGELRAYKLPPWPFTISQLASGLGGNSGHAKNTGVSVVVVPQATPAFVDDVLPPCLASGVLLANLAAEHLNVWAAKTLLPEGAAERCVGLVDCFMSPSGRAPETSPRARTEASRCPPLLERFLRGGSVARSCLAVDSSAFFRVTPPSDACPHSVLSVEHTHGCVNYPLLPFADASRVTDCYLYQLAGFLAPLLSTDALFTLQVPLYLTTLPDGSPSLFRPLKDASRDAIDGSVFVAAARRLYLTAVRESPSRAARHEWPAELGGPASHPASPSPGDPRRGGGSSPAAGHSRAGGAAKPPASDAAAADRKREVAGQIAALQAEFAKLSAGSDPAKPSAHSHARHRSLKKGSVERSEAGCSDSSSRANREGPAGSPATPRPWGSGRSGRGAGRADSRSPCFSAASASPPLPSPQARGAGRQSPGGSSGQGPEQRQPHNPLSGSMDQMVHLTKAFRLRQESAKHPPPAPASRARSASRDRGAGRPPAGGTVAQPPRGGAGGGAGGEVPAEHRSAGRRRESKEPAKARVALAQLPAGNARSVPRSGRSASPAFTQSNWKDMLASLR